MNNLSMNTVLGKNNCRIQYKEHTFVFRHNGLQENIPLQHHVHTIGDFTERKYDNRIDVYEIVEGKEMYRCNFNWTLCKSVKQFQRECENFFYNWYQLNQGKKREEYVYAIFPDVFPHSHFHTHYEEQEEAVYITSNNQTLIFVPQEANFETERINVFQLLDDYYVIHRSNFQMTDIQGKEDFIATCQKYFRIWYQTNEQEHSFKEPIFNDFPWINTHKENTFWEFDKFTEYLVLTPRTFREDTKHPLLYPFLKWKEQQGYKVSLSQPDWEYAVRHF